MTIRKDIEVVEVGLRDGLQLVKKFPSTSAKQRWVREEYAAGVRHFEVGSFLPAKTFPQFADVRDIVATVAELPGAHGIAQFAQTLDVGDGGIARAVCIGLAVFFGRRNHRGNFGNA